VARCDWSTSPSARRAPEKAYDAGSDSAFVVTGRMKLAVLVDAVFVQTVI